MTKEMDSVKLIIKNYLDERAKNDELFSKILEIRPSVTEQEVAETILDFWISDEPWTRYEFGHLRSLDLFEQQTE